jgi:hypothetical protein
MQVQVHMCSLVLLIIEPVRPCEVMYHGHRAADVGSAKRALCITETASNVADEENTMALTTTVPTTMCGSEISDTLPHFARVGERPTPTHCSTPVRCLFSNLPLDLHG